MVGPAAPEADTAWPADAVEIGRVIGAWGVKGWIRVQPYSAHPQALLSSRRWFLRPDEAGGVPQAEPTAQGGIGLMPLLQITQAREHNGAVVACAQQLSDRAAAQALRGARVFVPRSSFPRAGADEYYWVDLIGLDVVNREGLVLGTVSGLIDTGPHSVLRVASAAASARASEEGERLIPFVAAYVDEVSLQDRRITVDWDPDY